MTGELLLQTQEALLVARLNQFMGNGGSGGEAGLDALLTGGQADPNSKPTSDISRKSTRGSNGIPSTVTSVPLSVLSPR